MDELSLSDINSGINTSGDDLSAFYDPTFAGTSTNTGTSNVFGSTNATAAADNSGNTSALTKYDTSGFPVVNSLAGLQKFITDNKGLITAGGAALGLMGASQPQYGKSGYQGAIPELSAGRNMITAPPTKEQGYRPGAGGINYGGDVTYARTPGMDPWWQLSGESGTSANANLGGLGSLTPGGTSGISGGGGTSGISGGTSTVTNAGANTVAANAGSLAYQNFIKGGGTPQGYLDTINNWLKANPNVTNAQLQAKMNQLGVTATDLQTALGAGNYSAAEKYALSHGMGSSGVNDSINNWLAKYPNATAQQITDAMKSVGMSMADVQDAFAANPALSSKADQWNILNGKGTSSVNSSINNYLALNPTATAEQKQVLMDQYGISAKDVAEATALPLQNKAAAIAAGEKPATEQDVYSVFKSGAAPDAVAKAVASSGLSTADLAKDFGLKAEDLSWLRGQGYLPAGYAEGGEIDMAKGRYLQGETDGMADEIPAQIGHNQPAALSHGEFVVPADVVSHLGNGNSDAGAKKLYQMMDKIRMARTGTKHQGKKINPDKFMPGGLAQAYANGGAVKHFETGGPTGTALTAGLSGVESNLSNWAGPYVTNMLGQGQALANMPYTPYMGTLTAGESPLQTQAFGTASGLTTPSSIGQAATTAGNIANTASNLSYTPTTTSFDATQASQYMNPYLQTALQPQLEEARRQSQITQAQNASKMTQAGAFGGGRQAILDAETQRALGANLANITGTGYSNAYDKAMSQFNADQQRKMQENQYGAGYGLQGLQTGLQAAQTQGNLGAQESQTGLANLNAQLTAGQQQRGIEAEGIAADKAAFEEARANPYKMVQFQQSLLQGLPLAAQSYNMASPSALTSAMSGATTVADLIDILNGKTPAKKA